MVITSAVWLACQHDQYPNLFIKSIFVHRVQANAIGRSAKTVREFLEKNYKEEDIESDELVLKLAVRALLEVLKQSSCTITAFVLVIDQDGM